MSDLKVTVTDETGATHELTAKAKDFSTGSRGYHALGKLLINGELCQTSVMLTVVGSKQEQDAPSRAANVAKVRADLAKKREESAEKREKSAMAFLKARGVIE